MQQLRKDWLLHIKDKNLENLDSIPIQDDVSKRN